MKKERLYVHHGFLSKEKCRFVIDAVLHAYAVGGYASVHNRTRTEIPVYNLKDLQSGDAFGILNKARKESVELVTEFYGVDYPVWNEYTLLSDLHGGDYHRLHADNEKIGADGAWVPNHTPWRNYTAMLYLNTSGSDFQGGHIRFTEIGQDIAPEEGLLVGFGCDRAFMHETTPVTAGHRYAVSLWMTSEKERAENW